MTGFGKKGLEDQKFVAAKRDAFLAAERARIESIPSRFAEIPAARTTYRTEFSKKSLFFAYLLWFTAGGISAHRFYLGAWRSAFTQIGMVLGGALFIFLAARTDTSGFGYIGAPALILGLLWILGDCFLLPGVHRRMSELSGPGQSAAAFA